MNNMEKIIKYLGEKFRVRYFFDPDVRKEKVDAKTGESFEVMLGNIEGVDIFTSDGDLLGSFDYINFNDDEVIKRIISDCY